MKNVAFICVHNSCRSQMAEAFGRILGQGVFNSFSAGTEERDIINQDAVSIMKEIGIDMELIQYPKLIEKLPKIDIVVTMGCNVKVPDISYSHIEDWGVEDPSGQSRERFVETRDAIFEKTKLLVEKIKNGEI